MSNKPEPRVKKYHDMGALEMRDELKRLMDEGKASDLGSRLDLLTIFVLRFIP